MLHFLLDPQDDRDLTEQIFPGDERLRARLDAAYPTALPLMERTAELYQESWDEIDASFSAYIERVTGHTFFYPQYECVLSAVHVGTSNWGYGNRIFRTWRENPWSMRRITAHELILSHYFEIVRRQYPDAGLTDGQIWALAEIAAFALTSLTEDVKAFWPWDAEHYTDHNYPHLVPLQTELAEFFPRRRDFAEYMTKGFELVQRYPGMGPESA